MEITDTPILHMRTYDIKVLLRLKDVNNKIVNEDIAH